MEAAEVLPAVAADIVFRILAGIFYMNESYTDYYPGGYKYKVIYSRRRTIQISVVADDEPYVLIRVPLFMRKKNILAELSAHDYWIRRRLTEIQDQITRAKEEGFLSEEDINDLKKQAKKHIPERVRYFADIMHVEYNKIYIRAQNTRWGSCSSKGNLNFNCLLMLTPPEVIDSVVVHELAHRLHMNHSKEFYAVIRKNYPEYDKWNNWLKKNGKQILLRKT